MNCYTLSGLGLPMMRDIFFKCQACGQDLVVDAAGAGLEVNCPECNAAIVIPRTVQTSSTPPAGSPALPQDSIPVVCTMPLCCKHFSVPADMAGKRVKCPCCERDVQVPRKPEGRRIAPPAMISGKEVERQRTWARDELVSKLALYFLGRDRPVKSGSRGPRGNPSSN